jgi:hypothetical protein
MLSAIKCHRRAIVEYLRSLDAPEWYICMYAYETHPCHNNSWWTQEIW